MNFGYNIIINFKKTVNKTSFVVTVSTGLEYEVTLGIAIIVVQESHMHLA